MYRKELFPSCVIQRIRRWMDNVLLVTHANYYTVLLETLFGIGQKSYFMKHMKRESIRHRMEESVDFNTTMAHGRCWK